MNYAKTNTKESESGIYHIILREINKQQICAAAELKNYALSIRQISILIGMSFNLVRK